MRAPDFWRRDGPIARLLSPLGGFWGLVARARLSQEAPKAALPTVIVGGLTAGGDGKTPLVMAVARRLLALGERPALLTRGYGRRRGRSEPFVVDPARHAADEVGDEALLLARAATTIVGVDRAASAALAQELGASVLVLDDGFHSRRLGADLAFLAIDADYGAGNGRCLPAGPLRAPLDSQFAAADALVVIGEGAAGALVAKESGKPMLSARLVADPTTAAKLAGACIVAFAGIARPEKFFRTLAQTGAKIVATRRFGDHHRFSRRDFAGLAALERRFDARLATTEKDAARIGPLAPDVLSLPVALAFEDASAIDATLAAALERRLNRAS